MRKLSPTMYICIAQVCFTVYDLMRFCMSTDVADMIGWIAALVIDYLLLTRMYWSELKELKKRIFDDNDNFRGGDFS